MSVRYSGIGGSRMRKESCGMERGKFWRQEGVPHLMVLKEVGWVGWMFGFAVLVGEGEGEGMERMGHGSLLSKIVKAWLRV